MSLQFLTLLSHKVANLELTLFKLESRYGKHIIVC